MVTKVYIIHPVDNPRQLREFCGSCDRFRITSGYYEKDNNGTINKIKICTECQPSLIKSGKFQKLLEPKKPIEPEANIKNNIKKVSTSQNSQKKRKSQTDILKKEKIKQNKSGEQAKEVKIIQRTRKPIAPIEKPDDYGFARKKLHKYRHDKRVILENHILEFLENDFLTGVEIFQRLQNLKLSNSQQRIMNLLTCMRSRNLVLAKKQNSNGYLYYTLPNKLNELSIFLGKPTFKENILEIVGDKECSMQDLIKKSNRTRPTVARWLEALEREQKIRTEIRCIPGCKNYRRYIIPLV